MTSPLVPYFIILNTWLVILSRTALSPLKRCVIYGRSFTYNPQITLRLKIILFFYYAPNLICSKPNFFIQLARLCWVDLGSINSQLTKDMFKPSKKKNLVILHHIKVMYKLHPSTQ